MKRIKKIIIILALFFINIPIVFASNKINRIDVDIVLGEDGNAKVTEKWDMHVDEKTEVYKALYDLGNSNIYNFKVDMDGKEFSLISPWNIDASFNKKAYKNGLNYTNDGVELCWGMSLYGDHIYTITYEVTNVVYKTEDAYALYWRFMDNNVMDPDVKYYNVKVTGPSIYDENEIDVWGFGDKGGYAYVSGGAIYMSNADDGYLSGDEYVVLLAKFPLYMFNTSNSISSYETFDDFYNMAMDGATVYRGGDNFSFFDTIYLILSALFWIIVPVVIVFISIGSVDKYEKKELNNDEILPYRDIPCDKDITKAYFISNIYNLGKRREDYFGALFLKWILEKKMDVVKQDKSGVLKNKEITALQLYDNLTFDNKIEEEMYSYLKVASNDMLLEENELKKWCRANYSKFFKAFDDLIKEERTSLINEGHITIDEKKKNKFYLDEYLYNEAIKLAGLKKFLVEFSRMNEKQPIEVKMWKYYLIFASIFGLSKAVSKQFEKLYPELLNEVGGSDTDSLFWTYMWVNNITTTSVSAASSARSAAESYSGGGGGFSSGGGGGGSFGGGGGGCR